MYTIKDVVLDTLKGTTDKVSKEIKETRLKLCLSCPHLTKITRQCQLCGCFIDVKVLYSKSECPNDPPYWNEQ